MTARERGFMLLASHLGDPDRKPLTGPQLRILAQRVREMEIDHWQRDLEASDLAALGYGPEMQRRILSLLEEENRLDLFLQRGKRAGCTPITRVTAVYPLLPRRRLGDESPGCLWAKGDISLLGTASVALVGSRALHDSNRCFAEEVGRQAAWQGLTLVSGNARGADRAAQQAALDAGGKVISVVADELTKQPLWENILYLSEDGYVEAFSAQRALSRNRLIHSLGWRTFVAQTGFKTGGTWDGTVKNLRYGWSGVYCFDDGSEAAKILEQMGAMLIGVSDLADFGSLPEKELNFFDR